MVVQREALRRNYKGWKLFFKRARDGARPPRFKGREFYNSFAFVGGDRWSLSDKALVIHGIGGMRYKPYPLVWQDGNHKKHRVEHGQIKKLTIIRRGKRWYAHFSAEIPDEDVEPLPPTGRVTGIDVGLTNFVTTSEGTMIANPRIYSKYGEKLRNAQRALSRKKRGSNNRRKAIQTVRDRYEKMNRARSDAQRKIVRKLLDNNDMIAHEDLQVASMKTRGKKR